MWYSLSASSSARTLPRKLPEFSSSLSSIDHYSLYAESPRVRRATPCCRRRRMTVCFQVWILQTLSAVVSRFRGQNTLLLCLHVRRSGLCCQPDPPVLPTGSVVRIPTTLPEDHLPLHQSLHQTIRFGRLSYQKDWEIRNLSSTLRTGDRSQAICCVPMETRHRDYCLFLFSPSSARDVGGSFHLHSHCATPVLAHVWTWVTVAVHCNLMITLL